MKAKSPRPVSRHPMPLAAYLTGTVGLSFFISAPQAEAAVTAVTFPVSVLNQSTGPLYNAPTSPSLGGLTLWGASNEVAFFNTYHLGNGDPSYGNAKFFADGAVLGAGGNGNLGYAWFTNTTLPTLAPQLNKNIGFQTTTGNWGWANVNWNAFGKEVTINSAYVESVPGASITVGAVPEPSRALLALAGFGAVALRRRRKQAA